MDGYSLTNKMLKLRRRHRFTATEQALFYELVNICNSEDWAEVFDCGNEELCCALSITEKTLIAARDTLIGAGLIFFKSGKSKRVVCRYSFSKPFQETVKETTGKITVDSTVDVTGDITVDSTADVTGDSTGDVTDYYKLKQKRKKKTSKEDLSDDNKPKGYENYSFSFLEPDYRDCFFEWLSYKRERGERYKTQNSLKVCYSLLKDKSGGDAAFAAKIVENSIGNNYAGLYPPKNDNGNERETKHSFAKQVSGKKFEDF